VAALFDGRPDAWNPDLSGSATLTGSSAAPDLNLTAQVGFPRSGSLSNSHIDLELHGRGDTRTRADVVLKQGTATLARVDADAPLRFTFAPVQFGLGEDSLSARAKIDQLNLVELGPLLPAGVSTKGIIATDVRVEGPAKSAAIGGFVRIDKLEAELPGRRYLALDFASNLGGTLQVPEITGTLRIQQARLRIPERQNLLPTTGKAILWERASTPDTAATAGTLASQSVGVRLPFDAKVEMKLDVPSGFWILGKDLGVELSGDLDVGVRERLLIVSGTLEASQGWLTLMGRNFELEQGRCEFDGINTLNPELQIAMQTRIKSTEVTVSITGDVEEPDLELTSVPEMSEGNILSMLVFGVSADELEQGETDFLATQAMALAQSYSGAKLGQVLGDQLGVDMVRFKTTGDEDDTSSTTALEIGKYLTPNILVQYEIDLETGRGRDVTMEYRISDRMTLDSIVSRAARSGLRLTWGEDY
jgi:translocation and assembly module TamB